MQIFKELEEFFEEKIAILDGAMGTEIAKLNYEKVLNEELNLKKPEEIKKIHLNYLKAGADIIETNTFSANKISLKDYGLENKCFEINKRGAEIARGATLEFKERKFVAGSIGPTNKILSFSNDTSFDEMEKSYYEQILGLLEGGVDFLLIETITDSLNVKSCIFGMRKAFKETGKEVPFVLSLSVDKEGRLLNGQTIESFVATFLPLKPFGFGLNCSFGPENFEKYLKILSKTTEKPIFFYPNAGIPDKEGKYNYSPKVFSNILKSIAKNGLANVLGGCCGTNPEFIKFLKEEINGIKPKKRKVKDKIYLAGLEIFEVAKDVKPVIAGERCNIKGCKEFKEAILRDDFDGAYEIAKEQVESGSEIIDIFFQDPERDEFQDWEKFLSLLLPSFKKSIMVDSQDLKVIEMALKKIPGKGIVNSVNLEDKKRFEEISRIAKDFGSFLVFQTIENKIEMEASKKIEVAKKGYEILTGKIKFEEKYIIFDPVILPAAVPDFKVNHIFETLKTIKNLKKIFPNNLTILGISNVSFGFPKIAREVLNSVFLYYATKYGLDIAILNPKKIKRFFLIEEKMRKMAEDLIFKLSKENLKRFFDYFKDIKEEKKTIFSLEDPEKIVENCILKGEKKNLKEALAKLKKKMEPLKIIEEILIPLMEKLGEKFGKGEVILPEVLESASSMKYAIDFLKAYLKSDFKRKGRILVATVKGDVHDIGKNLFSTIAKSNGYEVIDLGVKVSKEEIFEKAKELKPDFVGLSGLLSRSCFEMVEVAKELSKLEEVPILILGGAALTKTFTENKIKPFFKGNLFYASSAMEGINILNRFLKKNEKF
jgi:5-methyltetrahydrofolate--homocysteine methyltransferase